METVMTVVYFIGSLCFIIAFLLDFFEKRDRKITNAIYKAITEIEKHKFDNNLCAVVGLTQIAFGYNIRIMIGYYKIDGLFKAVDENIFSKKLRSVKQINKFIEESKTLNYDKYAASCYNKYMEQLIDNTL